ncbi:GTPase Era [Megalodesulfovibrio paquesii]
MEHAAISPHRAGMAALIGPPNVGKSTLLNAIIGEKLAIVTPKPQTTRTQITGIHTVPGLQIVFFDTPGIHQRKGRLNKALLQAAWQSLHEADVAVACLDAAKAVKADGLAPQVAQIKGPLLSSGLPLLVVLNKVDLVKDKGRLLPLLEEAAALFPEAEIIPVSAVRKTNLDRLLERIAAHLPESEPLFPEDQISTAQVRFLAAEIVREKLFLQLRQEVPYGVAVDIEQWEEDPATGFTRISAVIYLAREAHKGMVIGRQGQTLKEIGMLAREEIQELLEAKVHLELFVKVKEDWTENPTMLRELGYQQ